MKYEKRKKLYEAFCRNYEEQEDRSTEYLLQYTADMCGVDYGDVVDAFAEFATDSEQ